MWQTQRNPLSSPAEASPRHRRCKTTNEGNASRRTSSPYFLNRRRLRSRILAVTHTALIVTLLACSTDDFGPQRVITTAADGAKSVYAADLDGDGDMDVLSASFKGNIFSSRDHKIAWYENTDGAGRFGPQQVITTAVDFAKSAFAADLDGDGDTDVLSASGNDDRIAWYENTDGAGDFGPQRVINTAVASARWVHAADLDGDGDIDVLSASGNRIAWYENTDGAGSFGPQRVITTAADRALSVYAADLDGDGDADVLFASAEDDKIAWYENTDGAGGFGPQRVITTAASGPFSVYAADLDGDGDMDVLSASAEDDKIAWYENLTTP